jgi:hypothetical protein
VHEALLNQHHLLGDTMIDVDKIKGHIDRISGTHRSEFCRMWGDYIS